MKKVLPMSYTQLTNGEKNYKNVIIYNLHCSNVTFAVKRKSKIYYKSYMYNMIKQNDILY